MKTLKAGLISAGGVSKSFIARFPALLATVGPMKATSLRVARRIANSLRAGYAVESYAAFAECSLIWIALPEAPLDRVLGEIRAEGNLQQKTVVVCGTARSSASLATRECLATLDCIPGDERTLVAEGNARAIREIHRLASAERRRLIEIPASAKPLYIAGVYLAADLLLPYFGAAVEMLRSSGFSRAQATAIAEGLGLRAIRAYAKAGPKAWSDATRLDLRGSRERDLAAIRATDPARATLYERGIEQAIEYFKA